MPWTICIRIPKDSTTIDGHRQFCFPIYVDTIIFDPRPPEPRPPIFNLTEFDQEKARYLQLLATIDQVAEELPNELSRDIQRSVAAHMQSIGQNLGVGIELFRQTQNTKCN